MLTKVKTVCAICGKDFFLGYDGTGVPDEKSPSGYIDVCDGCAGVERDNNGWVLSPGEM